MDTFAGLEVSLETMHICILDRDGTVMREAIAPTSPGATAPTSPGATAPTSPGATARALDQAPACTRVVFETGRMAPMLHHGLAALGAPVVCIEGRQAHQALKTLAAHKTDRNDARGLARLARTGFFKPVHVKVSRCRAIGSRDNGERRPTPCAR